MRKTRANQLYGLCAALTSGVLLAIAGVSACGGTASSSDTSTGGSTSAGTGGSSTAGAGATSNGGHANGGGSSGGASSGGTGSTIPAYCQAGTGGAGTAPEVKACQTDTDCEPMPTQTCCGPSVIVGIAAQDHKYEACFPAPTGCPAGLGCASQATTEDGQPAGYSNVRIKVSCSDTDAGTKTCRTLTMSASEGTLWSCSSTLTGASGCEPVLK